MAPIKKRAAKTTTESLLSQKKSLFAVATTEEFNRACLGSSHKTPANGDTTGPVFGEESSWESHSDDDYNRSNDDDDSITSVDSNSPDLKSDKEDSKEEDSCDNDEQSGGADQSRLFADEEEENLPTKSEEPQAKKRKVAWVDEDDVNTKVGDAVLACSRKLPRAQLEAASSVRHANYQQLLQQKFTAAVGAAPAWADLDAPKEKLVEEDEDAIRVGRALLMASGGALPADHLQYRWLSDLNRDDVRSHKKKFHGIKADLRTSFAEKFPIALVTRRQSHVKGNGYASVYQVGAEKCFNLEHLFFENFPINASTFLHGDKKFVIGAKGCQHFFVYDLEASKEIRIPWGTRKQPREMEEIFVSGETEVIVRERECLTFLDTRTWRPTHVLRPPTPVGAISVASADTVYTHGALNAQVFVWDVRSRRARCNFTDDGCIRGSAIAASPNGRYLACGSNTGIVNVYDARDVELSSAPRPLKYFKQLLTSADCLQFNNTSEALVFSSKDLPESVKIAHFPSMRVFGNFPTPQNPLGCVASCAFSPNSGYLAFSTSSGKVQRMRLEYFGQF